MMKIFRSRSIAVLLIIAMVFTFSFSSAFAVSNGNGSETIAFKVDNYGNNVDDGNNSYQPKSLIEEIIEWLEGEYPGYDIELDAYYIKASTMIFDSEGNEINPNNPAIDDYISDQGNGNAFNQNITHSKDFSTSWVDSEYNLENGTILDHGISHVLFLFTKTPIPEEPEDGTLEITKEVIGDFAPDSDTEYEITIKDSQGNEVETAILEDGETESFDLAPGTYHVSESNAHGADDVSYSGDIYSENSDPDYVVVMVEENSTISITVTNTFDDPDGTLEIIKNVLGDFAPGDGTEYEISILDSEDDQAVVQTEIITSGTQTFDLAPGTYHVWESETNEADEVDYPNDTILNDNDLEYVEVVIQPDNTSTVTINNTFNTDDEQEDPESDIEVIKTIGEDGPPHEGVEFTLMADDSDFEMKKSTDNNGSILFEDVPAGNYTLSETLPNGFTVREYNENIVVEAGEDQIIFVVNDMIRNPRVPFDYNGSTINGYKMNEMEEGLEGWTINLYKGNSEEPIATTTTDENGYYEFTDLEPGTYTVAEEMQYGWTNLTPIEQEVTIGDERHGEGTQNFPGDSDLVAAIENDNLVFAAEGRIGNNALSGDHEVNLHTPSYNIEDQGNWIWNNNGVPVDFEINYYPSDSEIEFTVGNDESVFYNLPADYEFSDIMIRTRAVKSDSGVMINNLAIDGSPISGSSVAVGNHEGVDVLWISGQDLMDSDGFSLTGQSTMYWDTNNAPSNSQLAYQVKFGIVPVEEEHRVDFMNEEITNIDIIKEVVGNGPEEGYEVTLERIYMEIPSDNILDVNILEVMSPIELTIDEGMNSFNLPGGYYHLWESNPQGADEINYSGDIEEIQVPENGEGVVIFIPYSGYEGDYYYEGPTSITITNTFIPPTPTPDPRGSITVEKILLSGDEAIEDSDLEFTVNVSNGDDYNVDHTFTVNEPAEINGLELGTYTIEEINLPDGVEFDNISDDTVELTLLQRNVTVTVTNDIPIDDEPEDPTGSISIEKLLFDGEVGIEDSDVDFTVNISNGDDYDEDHTFSVNEPLEIDGLELGTYTIEEINIPEGYEFESISDEEVTIEEGNLSVVVFITNMVEEEPTGTLIIEKILTGNNVTDSDNAQEFTVLVTNENGYSEEHTFSVNQPAEITGLELGRYMIEEINLPSGYGFESISDEAVVLTGNTLEITVVVENSIFDEVIDDTDQPQGSVDDEIILDEAPPLGSDELPRTGQRHAGVFYSIGLMITGLGVLLKRFVFSTSLNE